MITFTFEAIGSVWSIDVLDPLTKEQEKKLLEAIQQRIEIFDKTYSRFRKDSLVTKMSQQTGDYVMPPDAEQLLGLYKRLYQITDGAVTLLIGDVLSDAGYDAKYSLRPKLLHKPDTWDAVMKYKHPTLTMKKTALLDFGAAGKGYLTDIVGNLLADHGIANFCIDASGDFLYKHDKQQPLRIGLEHPENPKQVIGVAEIKAGSLCGSAGNRRKWSDFHHIINPHTLSSPTNFKAIWVTAETGLLADALTTCLFFTQPGKLQKYFDFQYVIVSEDYTLQKSHDFPGEFFYN